MDPNEGSTEDKFLATCRFTDTECHTCVSPDSVS